MCQWYCGAVEEAVVEVGMCMVVVGMVGDNMEGTVGFVGSRGFGWVGMAYSHCCRLAVVGNTAVGWMGL
jgi:hypothetical protein